MRWLIVLMLLVAGGDAHARSLAARADGPFVELAGGFGGGGGPMRLGPSWDGHLGWWMGKYDDAYSLGRFTGLGLALRQDLLDGEIRTTGLLELRRGLDLIVVGIHGFAAGGVTGSGDARAASGRLGMGGKFRRHRFWGWTLRLEGGADVNLQTHQPTGSFAVLVGGAFARPRKKMTD